MSRFSRATAAGLAALKRFAGEPVTYRRKSRSIPLTAIRGSTVGTVEDANGQRLRTFERDYLIDAVDLDFGDGAVEPALGDTITDDGHTYELVALTDSQLPWRWHDRAHTRYRVHTVER